MASSVNVLCPNGHRVTVKVTPTTSVLHIIEEVCKKKGFQPDLFDIKSEAGKVPIDVTLQIRYANLANNAKLELIAAPVPRAGRGGAGASVSISIQLPDGARLKPLDFPVDVSLWEVLKGFEEQEAAAADSILRQGMEPVVVYMRDQISGETRLKATSLKALGLISGRGLLRLNHRENAASVAMEVESNAAPTMTPRDSSSSSTAAAVDPVAGMKLSEDQMKMIESISQGYREYQREESAADQTPLAAAAAANAATSSSFPNFPNFPAPNRDFLPEITPPPPFHSSNRSTFKTASPPVAVVRPQMEFADFKFPESGSSGGAGGGGGGGGGGAAAAAAADAGSLPDNSAEPCDRELRVFDMDLIKNKVVDGSSSMEDVDDDFFELTIDDLRSRMTDLQRVASEDAPLLTAAMRQKRQEAKFAGYHRTNIRILFPNRIVLQGMFRLRETVGALYDFVASNLDKSECGAANSRFSLYVTPPRQDLKDKTATLVEAGLVPAAKLYFGPKEGNWTKEFLSQDCLKNLVEQPEDLRSDLTRIGRDSQPISAENAASSEPKSAAPAKRTTNEAGGKLAGASGGKMPKWFAAGKKK